MARRGRSFPLHTYVAALALAWGGGLALVVATGEKAARASVSVAALFDQLVEASSAVAVVTPLEQHAAWEGNRIVTETRVRVDRIIAGSVPSELRVRTHGGTIGHIGQIAEGQATFALGAASLLFVRPHVDPQTGAATDAFVVVDGAQGLFAISGAGGAARVVRGANVGALVDPPGAEPRGRRAVDVLDGERLDDAAKEIVAAFQRLHPARSPGSR